MKVIKGIKVLNLIFFLVCSMQLTAQEKPNILIIMTDELSAESMSFNRGNKYINTPNIDQLAKTGVVFSNAYCANPLCVPSRSSIFTGRCQFTVCHGAYEFIARRTNSCILRNRSLGK